MIIPHSQPAGAMEPRQRPLHDLADFAQAAAVRRQATGSPRPDAPPTQPRPVGISVETPVAVQLIRSTAGRPGRPRTGEIASTVGSNPSTSGQLAAVTVAATTQS